MSVKLPTRLSFFPITMFAIVMGLSGLTLVYQKAAGVYGIPEIVGEGLALFDGTVFIVIAGLYLLKWVRYPFAVKEEIQHPVRINFFAATSISFLLLTLVSFPYYPSLSKALWYIGTALHTFLTFYTISAWINRNLEITHSNPAWFIPIVGNVIIPVGGAPFAPTGVLMFYFSIGMLFWLVLFTIILYRIIFHHQLAQKFIPTLFILIAPPAVGFLAYLKITGHIDLMAHFFLSSGLFFTFLLFFMAKSFMRIQFYISWWAFTFPMAAITLAVMAAWHHEPEPVYWWLGSIFLAITTAIVAIVAFRTVEHIFKGEICVQE